MNTSMVVDFQSRGKSISFFRRPKRLGQGYDFTDFSADLSQLSYKSHGWFFNVVGRFDLNE